VLLGTSATHPKLSRVLPRQPSRREAFGAQQGGQAHIGSSAANIRDAIDVRKQAEETDAV
jgi:hypothetical protein